MKSGPNLICKQTNLTEEPVPGLGVGQLPFDLQHHSVPRLLERLHGNTVRYVDHGDVVHLQWAVLGHFPISH